MAALGPVEATLPVSLVVGDREWQIGDLRIPFQVKQISRLSLDISPGKVDLPRQLAGLLRAAADHIEQGVDDAPADDGSGLASG